MSKHIEITDQAAWNTHGMAAVDAMLKGQDRELTTPAGSYFVFDESTADFRILLHADGMETEYRHKESTSGRPVALYLITNKLVQYGGGRRQYVDFTHIIDTKRNISYYVELGRSALAHTTIESFDPPPVEEVTSASRLRELLKANF